MTRHFYTLLVPVLLFAGLLSACASDSPQKRTERERQTIERLTQIPTVDISSRLYSQALNYKGQGDCDKAVPLFYRLAMRGPGFELAQYHLADCLFKAAPQSATDTSWLEALLWVRRSAEAGVPQAQGKLAAIYALGPDNARDLVEAAMWYHLFQVNPERKKPGFSSDLDRTELERIENTLTEQVREMGKELADAFSRTYWTPPGAPQLQDTPSRDDGGIDLLDPQGGDRRTGRFQS